MKENFDRDYKNACAKKDWWMLGYGKAAMKEANNHVEYGIGLLESHIAAFEEPLKRTREEFIYLNVGRSVQDESKSEIEDFAIGFTKGLNKYVSFSFPTYMNTCLSQTL